MSTQPKVPLRRTMWTLPWRRGCSPCPLAADCYVSGALLADVFVPLLPQESSPQDCGLLREPHLPCGALQPPAGIGQGV